MGPVHQGMLVDALSDHLASVGIGLAENIMPNGLTGHGAMQMPCVGHITSTFGMRQHPLDGEQ